MTPETAYDYAKRVKAIGLAFFPREPESLANIGTEFVALTEDQGDKVIRAMSARSKWDPAEFTRLVASVRITRTTKPFERDDHYGRVLQWSQQLSVGTVQQISNDAGRAAATMPTDDPLYHKAEAQLRRNVTSVFGDDHRSLSPDYLEHNTRSQLAYMLLRQMVEEAIQNLPERAMEAGQ